MSQIQPQAQVRRDGAIGVFDSGVGGLSVLAALRAALPSENFVYFADAAYCPYGGRSQADIIQRASAISESLIAESCKIIVVACNTATIAAISHLRAHYALAFVGMEPAIKPASALSRSGVVGVLATGASLDGEKFQKLLAEHAGNVRVMTQPCPGLVECIESGDLDSPHLQGLLDRYLQPLLAAGADVIVLGCTHYPFLRAQIAHRVGPEIQLIDSGAAVARQLVRVLTQQQLLTTNNNGTGTLDLRSSGELCALLAFQEKIGRHFSSDPSP